MPNNYILATLEQESSSDLKICWQNFLDCSVSSVATNHCFTNSVECLSDFWKCKRRKYISTGCLAKVTERNNSFHFSGCILRNLDHDPLSTHTHIAPLHLAIKKRTSCFLLFSFLQLVTGQLTSFTTRVFHICCCLYISIFKILPAVFLTLLFLRRPYIYSNIYGSDWYSLC